MKQILNKLSAFLIMLMCMSATAQAQTEVMTMVVTKKNGDVTRLVAKNITKVEWTNDDPLATTGTAKAIINGFEVTVPWVKLWSGGPKFAEFNVGAEDNKAENYGGYYRWGSSTNKGSDYNTGTEPLSGDSDTATKLWGSNWRMPTGAELETLDKKCTSRWATVNGVTGRIFTGKDDYSSNSIFLPAAGSYTSYAVGDAGNVGYYLSSTPDPKEVLSAYYLFFNNGFSMVYSRDTRFGYSIRPVLAE